MVKIHGIAYLIIGCLVAAASYYIDKQKLVLFIYAGLVLIMVGIFKLIFAAMSKERVVKQKQPAAQGHHQRFCPFCGAQINYEGDYCHFCGARIR